MVQAEARMRALFAQDEPPARDPAFSAAVVEALVRRQFREDVTLLGGATLAGGVALWAAWPSLQPALVAVSQGLAPGIAILALTACAAAILSSRVGAALGAES